ncbi:MAG: type VI secretion system lipoprotein TssJ [Desulfatitalea sp.]|nr:type VI secretion system lipoprotein TssJ [Desulfatitalea sp.]NNK00817.1 type VI secretion system lipoprotein TssJ [Desulfatitalea sp.]
MSYPKLSAALLLTLMLAGCASQALPPPDWSYEKDAITVHLKADAKLNLDDGVPHTLVLCLYQLKDPNSFNQLAEDTEGIYKLLECGLFDDSAAKTQRIILHPGQNQDVTLDRADGAKYLAAVAGYYVLRKDRMVRLYDVPVAVQSKGFIKRAKISKPGKLTVNLELGASQINN